MRWKLLGVIVALFVMAAIPAFTRVAFAKSGLVARSSISLAPGVTYTVYLDVQPRNVIDVTQISAGAPVVIKAVPASPDGHGATAPATTLCRQANAVACINGDFFNSLGQPLGGELVDGHWLRPPTSVQQQLWLNARNRFSVGAMPAAATQSLGATKYTILLPGQPISIPEHDAFAEGSYARTLVGWDAAGDRFLVTVEQGKGSQGMSLAQAAAIMRQLGATTAVNEDGGGSSQMVVGGVLHTASGSRPVANVWAVTVAPPAATRSQVGSRPPQPAPAVLDQPNFSRQWSIPPRS